ncbi:gene transfer agent family protein [Novosphingobium sp. ZN18A2]|uniref:gene transfer agent family protein n=1 Tax=Novosphingobium sp. ZN18A2 TaxID=3079861 RepID=UPI0030D33B27
MTAGQSGHERPNPHRGEAALVLDGTTYRLRPTFAALVDAEQELGPLFSLVERASAGELRLSEMVALFWHCLADGHGLSRAGFADAVVRGGLAGATPALRTLMTQVLKGGA